MILTPGECLHIVPNDQMTGFLIAAKTLRHLPCLQNFRLTAEDADRAVSAALPFISASLTSLTTDYIKLQAMTPEDNLYGHLPCLRELSTTAEDVSVSSSNTDQYHA